MSIQAPAINDGYDGNPIVQTAVTALHAFGGDLTFSQAKRLLTMWAHNSELDDRERVAVLARFPRLCQDADR